MRPMAVIRLASAPRATPLYGRLLRMAAIKWFHSSWYGSGSSRMQRQVTSALLVGFWVRAMRQRDGACPFEEMTAEPREPWAKLANSFWAPDMVLPWR